MREVHKLWNRLRPGFLWDGEACQWSGECGAQSACTSSMFPPSDPTCQPLSGEGPNPSSRSCAEGLVPIEGSCRKPFELGQSCASSGYEVCAPGLFCAPETSVCQRPPSQGEPCDFQSHLCAWNLQCVNGTCKAPGGKGAACTAPSPTDDGATRARKGSSVMPSPAIPASAMSRSPRAPCAVISRSAATASIVIQAPLQAAPAALARGTPSKGKDAPIAAVISSSIAPSPRSPASREATPASPARTRLGPVSPDSHAWRASAEDHQPWCRARSPSAKRHSTAPALPKGRLSAR